ncbi:MAG: hypothetical protein M1834_005972 [Cirrosporium novae-zelandiae]|nr:MAG: hypothetical protein M1834_005972 [Cirrosporium novae-zelandiae]
MANHVTSNTTEDSDEEKSHTTSDDISLLSDSDSNSSKEDESMPMGPWYYENPPCVPDNCAGYLCGVCKRINFEWLFENDLSATYDELYLDHLMEEQDLSDTTDETTQSIPLGTMAGIVSKQRCTFCRLLVRSICTTFDIDSPITEYNGQQVTCTLDNHPKVRSQLMVTLKPIPTDWSDDLANAVSDFMYVIIHRLVKETIPSAGRFVQGSLINLKILEKWVSSCHSSNIKSLGGGNIHSNSSRLVGFRVIDVKRQCIVSADAISCRFLALSYVWGGNQELQNTKKTQTSLEREGGLKMDDNRLPQTIKDAMFLVSQIKERYLWVDSLCIIQDDAECKHSQIAAMDQIYTHAIATIIAVSGDSARSGLPGIRPNTRTWTQHVEKVQDIILGNRHKLGQLNGSPWNSRAWTFQEWRLSGRSLMFFSDQVIFICESGQYFEDVHEYNETLVDIFYNFETNVDAYANLVEKYTSRGLSYATDALNAFTGLMAFIRPTFRGDFLYGLPSTELDTALLWQPIGTGTRRLHSVTGMLLFPSWSWASWAGSVSYDLSDPMSILGRITWLDSTTSCPFTSDEYRSSVSTETPTKWELAERGTSDTQIVNPYYVDPSDPDLHFLHPIEPELSRPSRYFLRPGSQTLRFEALTTMLTVTTKHMPKTVQEETPSCTEETHIICPLAIINTFGSIVGTVHIPASLAPSKPTPYRFIALSRTVLHDRTSKDDSFREHILYHDHDVISSNHNPDSASPFQQQRTLKPLEKKLMGRGLGLRSRYAFDTKKFDLFKPWCLMNVMMVAQKQGQTGDGVLERLGLGVCHVEGFFGDGNVRREEIMLG